MRGRLLRKNSSPADSIWRTLLAYAGTYKRCFLQDLARCGHISIRQLISAALALTLSLMPLFTRVPAFPCPEKETKETRKKKC